MSREEGEEGRENGGARKKEEPGNGRLAVEVKARGNKASREPAHCHFLRKSSLFLPLHAALPHAEGRRESKGAREKEREKRGKQWSREYTAKSELGGY